MDVLSRADYFLHALEDRLDGLRRRRVEGGKLDVLFLAEVHADERVHGFGANLTEADRVWFEQQYQVMKEDEEVRVVALQNDRDQFSVVLEKFAETAIIDRHEANGILFDKFFTDPDFRKLLLDHLSGVYDDIRSDTTA
jgi:hypothetical protein